MNKKIVVYDSGYGNTKNIAMAIGASLDAKVFQVYSIKNKDLTGVKLLVIGSPTYGGRPTQSIIDFIRKIPNGSLKGIKAAAFDTRLKKEDQGIFLRLLMKLIDFAAPKIATDLTKKGARLVTEPKGFFVTGKTGPLKTGELKRATDWGKSLS